MARTSITEVANEESTFAIRLFSWVDDAGDALLPESLTWTLSTVGGTIINSRENVIATPSDPLNIVLSGDDLALLEVENRGQNVLRILTIKGVFDSDLGNNLPFNEEYVFEIAPLLMIP